MPILSMSLWSNGDVFGAVKDTRGSACTSRKGHKKPISEGFGAHECNRRICRFIRKDAALRCRTIPSPGRIAILRDDYSPSEHDCISCRWNDFMQRNLRGRSTHGRSRPKPWRAEKWMQIANRAADHDGCGFQKVPFLTTFRPTYPIRYIVSLRPTANMSVSSRFWETDHEHCGRITPQSRQRPSFTPREVGMGSCTRSRLCRGRHHRFRK